MVYRKAWAVQYQRDRARGQTRYVDAEPTRSRLAELTAAHVTVRALGRACGLSDTGVKAILAGTRTQVQQETATRVARICLRDIYSDQATGHVPKIGAVRRVHALMAMGWSHHQLDAAGKADWAAQEFAHLAEHAADLAERRAAFRDELLSILRDLDLVEMESREQFLAREMARRQLRDASA